MATATAPGLPMSLTRHREAVELALQAALAGEQRSPVPATLAALRRRAEVGTPEHSIAAGGEEAMAQASRYVMGWEDVHGNAVRGATGKRIRPALAVMAASIYGDAERGLPAAVAIELTHNFSLVHDDIQDMDEVRHGRPTAYAVWGIGQGINIGDFLYGRAARAITAADAPADRRVAALDVLLRAIEGMIIGQWQDISFEARDAVTVEEYLVMVEGKTGVLLGAAIEMGAILGGAPLEDAAVLGRWGCRLGLAFQAIDDELGTWGDEALTGKSASGDIARKKKSLPVIHGLNDATAGQLIREAFENDRQVEETERIVAALEAAGAREFCQQVARRYTDEADAILSTLSLSDDARAALREVGDYFCSRNF